MSILDVASGAGEGLERYLARLLAEQKFAEEQRGNRATEDYRNRALEQQGQDRQLSRDILMGNQKEQARAKDERLALSRVDLRPIPRAAEPGMPARLPTYVPPEEYAQEKALQIPESAYAHTQTPFAGPIADGEEAPADSVNTYWQGTSKQLNEQETQRLARQKERRIEEWGPSTGVPVLIQTDQGFQQVDRSTGRASPVRDQAGQVLNPKATVDQGEKARFAERMEQAEPELDALEREIVSMNPLMFEAGRTGAARMVGQQSATLRRYNQIASNFINANLRDESGAVIAASEFDEARNQYLPYPGDDEKTLALKRQNRKTVRENMKKAAGAAYTNKPSAPAGSGGAGGGDAEFNYVPGKGFVPRGK